MSGGLISLPPTISWQSSSMRVLSNFDIQTITIFLQINLYKNQIRYIMSDYEYEPEYQYDDPHADDAEEGEDINTKVQLQYFEIEDLLRNGKIDKAIAELEKLYTVCDENNIKNYKVKIMSQLLTIYAKNGKTQNIASTLSRIIQLNKQEKYSENAVRSIITIVRSSNYSHVKQQLWKFIDQFDQQIKLKSYLFLLQRAIEEKSEKQSVQMLKIVQDLILEMQSPSASILLEFYSLEIKFNYFTGNDITDKLHQIQLKMPKLQAEAYMSQGHISVIKLALAQTLFESGNYQTSAFNIFQSFLQKAKYGNSVQLKQILKANALICLLIQNSALRKKENINALYHDISIPFRYEQDIQNLITLIDCYERQDIVQFAKIYEKVKFQPQSQRYTIIKDNLLLKMKKQKLIKILKSYKTIKFAYVSKRLALNQSQVEKMIFQLIVDRKVYGKINDSDPKEKYLQILQPPNHYLEIQTENLRELGRRYLKK